MINTINKLLSKDHISPNELEFFYHDYLKTGAKCKDGLNAVLEDGQNGYTSNRAIRDWTQTVSSKRDILERIRENVTPEKIAGFIGDLFDFQYEKHRSDNIRALHKVTARHLVIMFKAFDQLQLMDPDYKNRVIDCFLEKEVIEKSEWSKKEPSFSKLKNEVGKYADFDSTEVRMKSGTEVAAERTSSFKRGVQPIKK
jgi:hypothetical protein